MALLFFLSLLLLARSSQKCWCKRARVNTNISNAIAILAFRTIQMLDKQIGARISASLIFWHLYYDWTIEDGVLPRITNGRPETLTTLNLQSCNRNVWIEFNELA